MDSIEILFLSDIKKQNYIFLYKNGWQIKMEMLLNKCILIILIKKNLVFYLLITKKLNLKKKKSNIQNKQKFTKGI